MDLFKKCENYDLVKKAKEAGVYPYFHELNSKQGPEVVSQRINAMNAELAGIMARTGVKSLDDMDASIIHRRAF